MLVWLLIGCLFASTVTATDHHLAKKLLAQVDSDSAKNCDPKRYMEWNEAVDVRYKIHKKNVGFEQDECLLAPLIKDSGYGTGLIKDRSFWSGIQCCLHRAIEKVASSVIP